MEWLSLDDGLLLMALLAAGAVLVFGVLDGLCRWFSRKGQKSGPDDWPDGPKFA